MSQISVNISANKVFADFAERLLTSNSQSIHSLCAELLTEALLFQKQAKNVQKRSEIIICCDTLIRCLISGWTAAVKGSATPPRSDNPKTGSARIDALADPFCTKGFHIACEQIGVMLKKGHHISQQRALREVTAEQVNSTQHPTPKNPV